VKPIAVAATRGAWYARWRLVSLDGSTMDVTDEQANDEAFGRPGASRGSSAFPQFRFVSLVENGTHVLFGTRMSPYATGENTLAKDVLGALDGGMLCLADRGLFGYEMWRQALATKAQLLWRMKKNAVLPCDKRLVDGSYLSRIYPSEKDKKRQAHSIQVRVIEYRLGRGHRCRADLSPGHQCAGPAARSGTRTGRAVPRALGDRNRSGRAQDASARRQDRLAQQDS
ncbi:transposase IS4 family protein, partial [mine drainage metagenome]